ncbi:MAG: hypothetical protein AAB432_02035 [Patescibacteria group bacterium]
MIPDITLKDFFANLLTGSAPVYLAIIFFWAVFAFALYVFLKKPEKQRAYTRAVWSVIGFRALYALLLTAGQYYVWSKNSFTESFLNKPLGDTVPLGFVKDLPWIFNSKFGYFIFYSWGRFWLDVVISIGAALIFWWFLKVLERHKERFFETGETTLGLLCALVVGWPRFIAFVPLIFFSVLIVSIFRRLAFKEEFTTLSYSFLFALLLTLAFGGAILGYFNLNLLAV